MLLTAASMPKLHLVVVQSWLHVEKPRNMLPQGCAQLISSCIALLSQDNVKEVFWQCEQAVMQRL